MDVTGWKLNAWGGPLEWGPLILREPGPGEVLLKVEACGVGLTVLNAISGHLDNSDGLLPLTPGHEVVGRVEEVGDGVVNPSVGDRVITYFYLSCFACRNCLSGRESRCENLAGWYGIHRSGGYAPYSVLPAGNVVPLRADIPSASATVIPDAVATPVHVCLRRLELKPGDRVAVIGAGGGVGAHMIQVASACGAIVAGLESNVDKLSLVEELGAIPVRSDDLSSARLAPFEDRADAVIDLVGNPETLSWSLSKLAPGGRLCVLTTFRNVTFPVSPRELVFKESSIIGSRYASRSELTQAIELLSSGQVRPVVGEVLPAREVEALHGQIGSGTLAGRGAIVWD